MLSILVACIAMAAKDGLGVLLTVSEAKGRAVLAGAFDALGDLAAIAVTVLGAGAVITHGFTARTDVLLAALTVTSFVGTTCFTKLSRRIGMAQ